MIARQRIIIDALAFISAVEQEYILDTENLYWDLISAGELVKCKESFDSYRNKLVYWKKKLKKKSKGKKTHVSN